MNILVNAIDEIEESDVKRTCQEMKEHPSRISSRISMADPGWVEVAIADNGVGIAQEAQKRIFDPFFTTKAMEKVTGMGTEMEWDVRANFS
jgi:signal transduction histidine kinase